MHKGSWGEGASFSDARDSFAKKHSKIIPKRYFLENKLELDNGIK